nr:cupin-like domain-containing protein [Actinomycetota bacterium]
MQTTPTRTTPTRTTHSAAALLRAIAPVEAERFLAEHWEAKPLVVPRAEEGRFDDLLSARDVERLLTETAPRTPGFRLVRAGETVTSYTTDLAWRPSPFTGVADVRRVLAEFEAGATIVLQGLHHSWLPLARYCRGLEAFLGHPAQANAYFTPRGSQGLPVHHDTHEVFSLQVAGEKRWLVYEPVLELPLKDQRYGPELGVSGEPVLDVTLRAGDTLYLPRGWLHQALTSRSDSLHVTVGINVRRWIDEARALLDDAADDVELRRGVDRGEAPELPALDARAAMH